MIHSDNDEFPRLHLTTFGTRDIFERLKQVEKPRDFDQLKSSPWWFVYLLCLVQAWTKARIATAVRHGDHDSHHVHV